MSEPIGDILAQAYEEWVDTNIDKFMPPSTWYEYVTYRPGDLEDGYWRVYCTNSGEPGAVTSRIYEACPQEEYEKNSDPENIKVPSKRSLEKHIKWYLTDSLSAEEYNPSRFPHQTIGPNTALIEFALSTQTLVIAYTNTLGETRPEEALEAVEDYLEEKGITLPGWNKTVYLYNPVEG